MIAAATPSITDRLPVCHVALYKNGVGYFQHDGRVHGNQSVTIAFTTSQLNDVLKSLTALDLNGGRITASIPSATRTARRARWSSSIQSVKDGS
jgi:hypothetical protein